MNLKSLSPIEVALTVSVLLHAAVLTVRFVDPEGFNRVFEDTPLEVVLVNARSNERVDKAPLVTMEDVGKSYGNVNALRGVSLRVRQGEDTQFVWSDRSLRVRALEPGARLALVARDPVADLHGPDETPLPHPTRTPRRRHPSAAARRRPDSGGWRPRDAADELPPLAAALAKSVEGTDPTEIVRQWGLLTAEVTAELTPIREVDLEGEPVTIGLARVAGEAR